MSVSSKVATVATAIAIVSAVSTISYAADLIEPGDIYFDLAPSARAMPTYSGRVSVIDGRTLWFPQFALKVRLASIDACELPQWAISPKWVDRQIIKAPSPVPCGPLAKAWLKRTIGGAAVQCQTVSYTHEGLPVAKCSANGRDLAAEMLRVGWARVVSPNANPRYLAYQQHAMAARYGMWATYVLDMNEWRRRAVDKTLKRRPVADYDLLVTRHSEISPPFEDLRHKPSRTDR